MAGSDESAARKQRLRLDEAEWNRLSVHVQGNVLQRLLRRSDRLVDGPLRERLDELLQHGAERLLADIRSTMQQAIRDAVAQAIAEELSKMRPDELSAQPSTKPDK